MFVRMVLLGLVGYYAGVNIFQHPIQNVASSLNVSLLFGETVKYGAQ